jgi:hypothetical protein
MVGQYNFVACYTVGISKEWVATLKKAYGRPLRNEQPIFEVIKIHT